MTITELEKYPKGTPFRVKNSYTAEDSSFYAWHPGDTIYYMGKYAWHPGDTIYYMGKTNLFSIDPDSDGKCHNPGGGYTTGYFNPAYVELLGTAPPAIFNIGDVVVLAEDYQKYKKGLVGHIGAVDAGCGSNCVTFRYGSGGSFNVYPKRLKPYTITSVPETLESNITKEGVIKMTRYYKLLTDKPEYIAGAVLQGTVGGNYIVLQPTLFATEAEEKAIEEGHPSNFYYTFVEDSADFEQVYQIQHRDGVKYGTKAQAREAMLATNVEPKKSK